MQVLNNENGADLLNKHRDLFTNADDDTAFADVQPETPKLLPTGTPTFDSAETGPFVRIDTNDERFEVEDISHETAEEESLWLEDKEKEMIVRALKKHNYKRKYAAQALGISERTLYRKIKQYDIEDE